jgi:dihydroorotase
MTYLIKNGHVIDPAGKTDDTLDILISSGKIGKIGKDLSEKCDETIDAKGKIVAPGFIDMHVHLREPGREDEETVRTGTRAAVRGGFTALLCMPNTEPAIDSGKAVAAVKEVIKKEALTGVFITGTISEARAGKKLADIKGMKREGILAISDDGASVEDEGLMLEALKIARDEGLLLIDHCEDVALSARGVMNKGFMSTKMGLRGIPAESEYKKVKSDIELARKTGGRLHIAHVSCKETVDIIRKAKRDGVNITCETAPHHFTLTDECCATYDTNTKMNPPLRTGEDVEALKRGLADGTIDVIATDHAPHTDSEKDVEFDYAPFGIIGLETALSLAVMELVDKKVLGWGELISRMATNPARILGAGGGNLKAGGAADIVIIDPAKEYTYKRDSIESRSKNSPFIDWKLKARVGWVFIGGRAVMKDEVIMG